MQMSMFEAFANRLKSASHAFSKGVLGEDADDALAEDEPAEEAAADALDEPADALDEPAECVKSSGTSSAKDSPEEASDAKLSDSADEALS